MPYQVAFAWSKESEKELIEKGFKKKEVYIKDFYDGGGTSTEMEERGDSDFSKMKNPPFQFITTSYWGAGPD